jgi:hypothetical protein
MVSLLIFLYRCSLLYIMLVNAWGKVMPDKRTIKRSAISLFRHAILAVRIEQMRCLRSNLNHCSLKAAKDTQYNLQ